MSTLSALLIGLLLGMRHATDADHVVTIATIVRLQDGVKSALRVAIVWGLGHTATFFCVGLAIVAFRWEVPALFEQATELAVALLLVGLGASHFLRRKPNPATLVTPASESALARPFLAGIVHGLAGSAAVALLALATIHSIPGRIGYLALFGAGTVLGMCVLTVSMMMPLQVLARRGGAWLDGLRAASCAVSIVLGLVLGTSVVTGG
ncbi:MAG TPA: high-affinity nickel-transport family protein [Myxococcota bacterium]|nr:high-affinity nickel-transport family protein [Myxococcota bacterium]